MFPGRRVRGSSAVAQHDRELVTAPATAPLTDLPLRGNLLTGSYHSCDTNEPPSGPHPCEVQMFDVVSNQFETVRLIKEWGPSGARPLRLAWIDYRASDPASGVQIPKRAYSPCGDYGPQTVWTRLWAFGA